MINNHNSKLVSVIIPAFNEESTIADVITSCRICKWVSEVIVVDDDSSDHTNEIASKAGAIVCILPENRGKAAALLVGARQAKNELLLLLDADLIGLQPRHVEAMIYPVMTLPAVSTVGLFTKGRFRTDLAHWLTPFLSGQRCLERDFFLSLENCSNVRYGIEIVITKALRKQKITLNKVPLDGVTHRMKEEKRGHENGWHKRMEMYRDIVQELFRGSKKI
ncbi:glycosyltransferase [bacterium]|nr:glycosyltransferase [bacterium]